MKPRTLVWFSCGAASAIAAKLAVETLPRVTVVYCDLSLDEDADNPRFMRDVEIWIGQPVTRIRSREYRSVEEVFAARRYMSGIAGAPCTIEMKKIPRFEFQRADDVHVFGFTADEPKRIERFEAANPELRTNWILYDRNITKADCFRRLKVAGIRLPALYAAGFPNNNCIGCVKATSPKYWNRVRSYAPAIFQRRAEQSRELGCRLTRVKGKRIFLDELPVENFDRYREDDISCGPECRGERVK